MIEISQNGEAVTWWQARNIAGHIARILPFCHGYFPNGWSTYLDVTTSHKPPIMAVIPGHPHVQNEKSCHSWKITGLSPICHSICLCCGESLVGGLVQHEFGIFPLILGFDYHPNWLTHIFQRGGLTTNQYCLLWKTAADKTTWSTPWPLRYNSLFGMTVGRKKVR